MTSLCTSTHSLQDAIGPCGNYPCRNGGRCLDTVSAVTGNRTFFCLCETGWKGSICDIKGRLKLYVRCFKCNCLIWFVKNIFAFIQNCLIIHYHSPEASLGWSRWDDWSQCSTTCGNGYHVRQRKCKNLDSGADLPSSQCYGRDTEYKACQYRKCPSKTKNPHDFENDRIVFFHDFACFDHKYT